MMMIDRVVSGCLPRPPETDIAQELECIERAYGHETRVRKILGRRLFSLSGFCDAHVIQTRCFVHVGHHRDRVRVEALGQVRALRADAWDMLVFVSLSMPHT